MKIFFTTALIAGLAFAGFCGTTDETNIFDLSFTGCCLTTNETNGAAQLQQGQLLTRHYDFIAETFWNNLKRLAGIKEGEDNLQMLRRFFEKNGVEMDPPTVIFLDLGPFPKPLEGKSVLFARATEANQNKIERFVVAIQNNVQPSEVH